MATVGAAPSRCTGLRAAGSPSPRACACSAALRKLTRGQQVLTDELAQETFIKAWRALPTFRHGAQWSTWLHRIAYLEFLQHQRRWADEHASTASPEHEAIAATHSAHDLRLDLEKALAQLLPLENADIVYCYHGGLSQAEAAQVLDLPLGTVKSHVLRGRAKLQTLLAAWKPTDTQESP